MMDSDDMKSGLLQDLIEQILEMKDGKSDSEGADMHGMSPDMSDKSDDSAMGAGMHDPKAKVSILDIKAKPMGEDASADDSDDMHSPIDFASLRRKHELGM